MAYSPAPQAELEKQWSLCERAALILQPQPITTPDRWAELNRTYPPTSGIPGPRDPWLTPYMIDVCRAVAGGNYRRVVLATAAQMGKALALDTPLATPYGWTTMEAVEPGDWLFDELGKPCRITAISPVAYKRECFRVVFSDGASIVTDRDHLWTVQEQKRWNGPKSFTDTTGNLAKRTGRNVAIPVTAPLDLPDIDLPIQPYVLGAWLGDGHSVSAAIYSGAEDADEMIENLRSEGVDVDVKQTGVAFRLLMDKKQGPLWPSRKAYNDAYYRHYYHGETMPIIERRATMRSRLLALGLLGKKQIPAIYLRASKEQRLALLQGLMDTDGYCSKLNGHMEFCTTDISIAYGTMELIRSLGLKPVMAIGRAKLYGRDISAKYRIKFMAYADTPIFRLSRKRSAMRRLDDPRCRPTETRRRFITSIEPVPSVPVKCLTIDSPTHLYLAGEAMIPTHNSEGELDVIGHRLDQRPAPILFVGPNKQFLTEQFEPRIMALLDQAPILRRKVLRGKKMTKTRKVVAGVPLRLAHGGSSTALKSDPAGLAIMDEYDEMLANVKGQGDPLGLVEARGMTYSDFVVQVSSTPSVGTADTEVDPVSKLEMWKVAAPEEVQSAIWKLWQQGTRYHWTWQCPHCAEWFVPRFKDLKWPKDSTPAQARVAAVIDCPRCGAEITEDHKSEMNLTGAYVAPGQSVDSEGNVTGEIPVNSTASFWVSGLASPFVTWGQRAEAFLLAIDSGQQEKIQTEINAGFGELWTPGGGEAPAVMEVERLRLPYHMGDVPDGVAALTAGVDVQKNRLVYVIRGWGQRSTSWLIQHGELWGPTAEDDVWGQLSDLLSTRFAGLPIGMCLIDSGFRPNKREKGPEHIVYEFCRRHAHHCRASKGYLTLRSGAVQVSKIEVTPQGGKFKYSLDLVRVNSDWCKLWIHERIRWPLDQPGAFFLPSPANESEMAMADEYARQLVSEARLRKPSGQVMWMQTYKDNHYLDCEAMAYAAGYLWGVQRIRVTKENPVEEMKPEADEIPLRTDKPRPPRKRVVVHSEYLAR